MALSRIWNFLRIFCCAAVPAAALCSASAARAQTPDEFYKGKDVRILIGAGVGGTYGLYAQLAARHLRKHIPGQPNLVMQSMPGAGGNVALNYSFNVAPKDGTAMHLVHAEVLFETLLTKGVKFNARDYQYIGRIADGDALVLTTGKSGVKSLNDAKKRDVTLGATGISNVFALAPLMLNRLAGTKFKIIGGYKGASDIFIAMERGELDGGGSTYANVLALHAQKLKSGAMTPVVAIAARRLADFPNLPAITEFGTGAEKTLLEIYASSGTIGRALAFPPGVPAARLQTLRMAFQKMLADPEFQAEVKKANIPTSPMSGEALGEYVQQVMKLAPAQVDAARKLHEDLIKRK